MNIDVIIDETETTAHEFAKVSLRGSEGVDLGLLDINITELLRRSRDTPIIAVDFLFIAAVAYGIDKAIPRVPKNTIDGWSRPLAVTIPVGDPDCWNRAKDDLSECLSFLTGDHWSIDFRAADRQIVQRKPRRGRRKVFPPCGSAVSLFSGGLDSFIGAIDWLEGHKRAHLTLIGHYDGDVGGPKKDQIALKELLLQTFPRRFETTHIRVGLTGGAGETSFRSRSLVFLALAFYFAELLGEEVPVLIPENGPIALNFPLTPARRGACSTRTAHPHFLNGLENILRDVGFAHPIINPYQFKTKGEMVKECRNQKVLAQGYAKSRSCAKSGHKVHWHNRNARGCGACVPCLFRRASLHALGYDNELYGYDVCDGSLESGDSAADFRAMLAFLTKEHSESEIKKRLLASGPLLLEDLPKYTRVITAMRAEMKCWLAAKGLKTCKLLKNLK